MANEVEQSVQSDLTEESKELAFVNFDPERASRSNKKLVIDIDVYMQDQRQPTVMVITEGVLVLIKKVNKELVMVPISVDEIETLFFASKVPSAATIQFKADNEAKLGFSHLIIESDSLMLLLRYVYTRGYLQNRIDFCDRFLMRRGTSMDYFSFNELVEKRQTEKLEWSNGLIRAVYGCDIFVLKGLGKGRLLSSSKWNQNYAVITNIGIFIFK